jgi:transitional endoplasmic reticulum ATPase
VTTAIVQILPSGQVNFGQCYSNIGGLSAGQPVRVSTASAAIYCTLVWELSRLFTDDHRIALDSRQCAALGVGDSAEVELTGLQMADLPAADRLELRLTRWSGPPVDHSAGLSDFLRSGKYLLYPGLRFGFQPLGGIGTGEYELTTVIAHGSPVDAARVGDRLSYIVHPDPGTADWPPTYDDIGGLEPVITLLRREVELPLRRLRDLQAIGVSAPSGVLLYGPPGTGKTLLARAVAHHSGARTTFISGSELASRPLAEAEEALRSAFAAEGTDDTPRLVIVDDIDFLAPNRANPGSPPALLGLVLRALDQPGRPTVVATTSRRDEIDPAVRRLGRIGRQMRVPVPNEAGREDILVRHTRWLPLATAQPDRQDLLADLARRTAGFVGADLEALCQEAGCFALRRSYPVAALESEQPEAQAPLQIRAGDFYEALTIVTPSAIDADITDMPLTRFTDIAGLGSTVTALKERLVLPFSRPEIFAAAGLPTERGVLLYGPPGTGKTLLARAIANECGRRFIPVRGPELLNKWFGESERAVRDLFEQARSAAPCVVFFDEIEALARRRSGGMHDGGASDRVVNQLLAEIDGLVDLGQVSVIGATNSKESIDPAILRPGRLGLHIEVPLPDVEGRRELFEMYLPESLHEHCGEWAAKTPGLSGADIAMISREARLNALRQTNFEEVTPVSVEDVTTALSTHRTMGH